jgi:transcription antitermination protein NusB
MPQKNKSNLPRVRVIQKLYTSLLNPEEVIEYQKSQYKKFIKDVTQGTIERKELIEEIVLKNLSDDIDLKKTDKLLKIIIFAAIYELMFKHNNPIKVIISEYLKASEYFLEKAQIKYLNVILDKISKKVRNEA